MKKFMFAAVSMFSIISVSNASNLHQINSFSSKSFPAPVIILAE
ncbi:hypothetical protein [Francisella marina]|nr:hypothetical protein [Francisella marina]